MSGGNRLHYLALGLGLALASMALGQEPVSPQDRPSQNDEANEPSESQRADESTVEPPEAAPPIAPAEPPGEDYDENAGPSKDSNPNQSFFQWESWVTGRDTLAQWIMAAFGVVATFISIWAVILLRQTLRATRDAVEESRRATRAADDAVKVTSETGERQLRAYVHVTSAKIRHTASKLSPNIILALKNYGLTPAYNVHHATRTSAFTPEEEEFDMRSTPHIKHIDLGPGQKIFPRKIVSQLEWACMRGDVAKKARKLYVFGEIRYVDAFGNDRRTAYRFHLFIDDNGITDGDLSICQDGNEAT